MSKMLDVVMAGVISGIVAYTTSKIGIAGTVIGAVLGAMLYQIMSHYIKEPLENVETKKIETRIVYTLPLIIIVAIELIYILSSLYWKPQEIFYLLENATDWALFRAIGLGLIIMGIYPLLQPDNIKKSYGYIILSVGIIKLLNGFVDANSAFVTMYADIFNEFGIIISLLVIGALSYVTLAIIQESIEINRGKEETNTQRESYEQKN
ncbi:hypothetical protein [Methanobacterium oryzae]|uniref:hypothetical protein n=1 Tax=Methanobacterium oryzae TaxID=69540 RepID=UPI003D1A6BF1